ncbi:ecdysteroid-regulated 16 kDa protein-like [Lycorma delicatula]|uniref:ecdysteroid-regulated 16 kDa protein-like n=1 Tax=Lycorma delicatula TaxID=130591 RepID=UPI003F519C88
MKYFPSLINITIFSTLIFSVLLLSNGVSVKPCSKDANSLPADVNISDCDKPPCKLKKKTTASIEITFTPKTNVSVVTNNIFARLGSITAPFIGVDGTNACTKIYQPDGTKEECPLKAGSSYIYKNSFKVYEFYPTMSLTVHWGLKNKETKEDIACLEVEAAITD